MQEPSLPPSLPARRIGLHSRIPISTRRAAAAVAAMLLSHEGEGGTCGEATTFPMGAPDRQKHGMLSGREGKGRTKERTQPDNTNKERNGLWLCLPGHYGNVAAAAPGSTCNQLSRPSPPTPREHTCVSVNYGTTLLRKPTPNTRAVCQRERQTQRVQVRRPFASRNILIH